MTLFTQRIRRVLAAGLVGGLALGVFAQEEADRPTDMTRVTVRPKVIKQGPPVYPSGMSQAGLIGAVKVEFIIDKQGNVPNAYVVESNNPWFERAAIDAILGWKFEPGQVNGRPVNVRVSQLIEFNLEPGGTTPQLWRISKSKDHDKQPPDFRWEKPPTPISTTYPAYPFEQLKNEVKGTARVTYIVGPEGRVVYTKLHDATTPEFGLAALAAVDAWRFAPARKKDGTPAYANLSSEYEFKPTGRGDVPVNNGARDILRALDKKPESIVSLNDLDRPLKPLSRRPPVYPSALNAAGQPGTANIEFFIDKNGDAQLPRITSSTAPEFGYAAAQAVATWRFDAPKKNGKTVFVRTGIVIDFAPNEGKPATAK